MKINDKNWDVIRKIFKDAGKNSLYYSMATTDEKGEPHVTPIGSLFLRKDKTGFYFDEYTSHMSRNIKHNGKICVMAVITNKWLFYKSLFNGGFPYPVAVRISGTAGEKRMASAEEINTFQKLVKPFKWTKGYGLLWKDLKFVRDISFNEYEPVRVGRMKTAVDF